MFGLFSEIVYNNPPLTVLSMYKFSKNNYFIENINMGQLVLEMESFFGSGGAVLDYFTEKTKH